MARQGFAFTETEVQKIISLLSKTDMSIAEIAERMGCGRSSIVSINRRHQVRDYSGRRNTWLLLAEEEVAS
jgi:IS30 family transposase